MVASFLGERTFNKVAKKLGKLMEKVADRYKKYPTVDPMILHNIVRKRHDQSFDEYDEEQLSELNNIATEFREGQGKGPLQKKWKAQKIDCYLYVDKNKYK